jgi:hypothetical protein
MTDSTRRNRKQLLGMFAVGFLTLGAAYALFYSAQQGGVWGTTNNGTFVEPPLTVADLGLEDDQGRQITEGKTWWLWVVAPQGCGLDCSAALHQLRQLHVLLNKDADRVQRALVTLGGPAPAVMEEYPRLKHLSGSVVALDEGIYVIDPIGNLVFFYPLADAGKAVLDDLKRLLKLSQIG